VFDYRIVCAVDKCLLAVWSAVAAYCSVLATIVLLCIVGQCKAVSEMYLCSVYTGL